MKCHDVTVCLFKNLAGFEVQSNFLYLKSYQSESRKHHFPTTPGLLQPIPHRGARSASASNPFHHRRHRPQEAPRLLAQHMTGLARIDLEHLRGGATPVHQLTLVDQLVRLCSRTSPPPAPSPRPNCCNPPARLLSEIRSTALLPGQAETSRPTHTPAPPRPSCDIGGG